jgi:hypothetical protein
VPAVVENAGKGREQSVTARQERSVDQILQDDIDWRVGNEVAAV